MKGVAPGPRLLVMVLSTWGPRCCRASALAKSNPNTHASAGLAFQCFCYSYILDIPRGPGRCTGNAGWHREIEGRRRGRTGKRQRAKRRRRKKRSDYAA